MVLDAILQNWLCAGNCESKRFAETFQIILLHRLGQEFHFQKSFPTMFHKVALVILAIVAFVAQSELVQLLQGKYGYYKPWFLMLFSNSAYVLVLPICYIYIVVYKKLDFWSCIEEISDKCHKFGIPPNRVDLKIRIMWISIIYSGALLAWFQAVSLVALSDITAIYNTACFFAYLLSIVFLREKFMWTKFLAVVNSIIGVFIIAWGQGFQIPFQMRSFIGYGLSLLSAVLTAGFEVLYTRTVVPEQPSAFLSLVVTGGIGIYTLASSVVLLPILHFSKLEVFEFPDAELWPLIIGNSLCGLLFNAIFMIWISYSSPTMASIGVLLSIPAIGIIDYFFFNGTVNARMVIGSILILIGFSTLKSHDSTHSEEEVEPIAPLDDENTPLLD